MKNFYSLLIVMILLRTACLAQYTWNDVGGGMNSPVYTIATDTANDILYAGGIFSQAGGIPALSIAKWNGATWAPLGGGVISGAAVSSLLVDGTDLIAGGTFTNIGGILSKNIAKWDGTLWAPLGPGLDYTGATTVSTLVKYNGELYAGGIFDNSGGSPINNIAKWDGTNWQPLTTGTNGIVSSLCVYGTDLYVGGTFTDAGGVVVKNIAKWDGTVWSDVGGGVFYTGATTVSTLQVYGGELYAGGRFDTAGGVPVRNIAKWDGSVWSDVGGGAGSYTGATTVSTFTVFANELIVGGNLDSLGLLPVGYIGKWDGAIWSALGTGTNNSVLSLATMHDTLYAGGLFPVAGGNAAPFIAEWIPDESSFISVTNLEANEMEFILYPNPADDNLHIKTKKENFMKDGETYFFKMYDLTGREIYKCDIKNEITIGRNNISSGLYIYKIISNENDLIQQGKISFR